MLDQHQARNWLDLVVASTSIVLFVTDREGRFTYSDGLGLRALGLKPGEAVGRSAFEMYKDFPQIISDLRRALAGEDFVAEVQVGELWFECRYCPLRESGDEITGLIGVAVEISERKQNETALRLSEEKHRILAENFENERQMREQFLNTLSHDLRNPLTVAKINAQMIETGSLDTAKVKMLAQRIVGNLNRLDRMLQDALDMSWIRAGNPLPLEIGSVNLLSVIQSIGEDFSTVYGNRFTILGPDSLEGFWSSKDIRRLVENLLSNAVKYGYENSPITVTLRKLGESVSLAVQNFGLPIQNGDQAFLFDAFKRSKAALAGCQQGWGLGLTLVRAVAEAHGGRVTVESSAETGTVFTVMLPLDARHVESMIHEMVERIPR